MTNDEAIRILSNDYDVRGLHNKALEALDLAIAALERDRWIPVEAPPEEKTEVLISVNQFFGGPLTAVAYLDSGIWLWRDDMSTSALPRPTHWRQLPEPPKEDNM